MSPDQTKQQGETLWQGRSDGSVSQIMLEMGESISLDIEIYSEDIRGSLAHAKMLQKTGILTPDEVEQISSGLKRIETEIEKGELPIRIELEDIHTHIENRLIELIGETGKKLHTARSRNDQVAVDTHLYVKKGALDTAVETAMLCEMFLERAKQEIDTILPGYTHLQVAQPIRLSHHLLAHFWAFLRDVERMLGAFDTADSLPLGSGAMAGVNYKTDRDFLREELQFRAVTPNSMDAVASRDHILDFLYASTVLMSHASRVAEEIILWNSVEFSFLTLPDSLTTGSSIMPQKKNPDLAELSRGKTGRVTGNLFNLLMNIKGLPLTYNRDLQEDRFPLLDTRKQVRMTVTAMSAMVREMKFNRENMQKSLEKGFATATDLADALVAQKGVPFREAHHIAGKLVGECVRNNHVLKTVPEEIRSKISPHLADGEFYLRAIDLVRSTDKKVSAGGSSREEQVRQIDQAGKALEAMRTKIDAKKPNGAQ